ncbi:MAG: DUF1868 domain-containing protein [Thermoguttaceae bacterium]|nr:DUF1868 domain-containing protein [Thermoguttaceae bacterium]
MIHTLKDYISDSMPQTGGFTTNANLVKKVDANGKLLPFYGNTVVFLLDDESKRALKAVQDKLYAAAPDMLAEPLPEESFHLTAHDLANNPENTPELRAQMAEAAAKTLPLVREVLPKKPIQMKATWAFNMVSVSIVVGWEPADEESYAALDKLYTTLEKVVPLGYALCPHITLAYFRPGVYEQEAVDRLRAALQPVDWTLELKPENLVLQNFESMSDYKTVDGWA